MELFGVRFQNWGWRAFLLSTAVCLLEKMTILAQEAKEGLTKAEDLHQKETAELREGGR